MNIQDPISDMLIRIKNSQIVNKYSVFCNYSKINLNILNILYNEGFIISFKKNNFKIEILLRYFDNIPAINTLKRISKPSVRVYYNIKKINKIRLNPIGIIIISTSRGLMTHKSAKKYNIGGEALFYIS